MDSGKQLVFPSALKVYRPSPKRYLKLQNITAAFVVAVFSLFILIIPIFQASEWKIPALFIVLVCFGPLDAFFVFYFLWRTHVRLVASVEGIGYSTAGFRIFTPWDNVAGIGTRDEFFQGGRGPGWTVEISGLELLQPAPVYKARPLVRLFLRLHAIERPSFFIPISNVVENWQDSEVIEDIQHFAPQLARKMPLVKGASWPNVNRLRQRRDVDGLIAVLIDPDDEKRRFAASALGEIKDPRAVDSLIRALQDPVHIVRETAANALGNIGDVRAADPLLQVLGTDLDLIAIAAIQKVLVNIGDAQAREYLLAFQKKLAYGDPRRSSVAFLLEQIQSSNRKGR